MGFVAGEGAKLLPGGAPLVAGIKGIERETGGFRNGGRMNGTVAHLTDNSNR
jgi:hypothetical protein